MLLVILVAIIALVALVVIASLLLARQEPKRVEDVSDTVSVRNQLLVSIRVNGVVIQPGESSSISHSARDSRSALVIEALIDGKYQHFSTYSPTTDEVFVGSITSRWVSGADDTTSASSAIQGRPYIRIHNMTDVPLVLNDNISIAPQTTLHYKGKTAAGVSLGTLFDDPRGIFHQFTYNTPATDIYYVVSGKDQLPFSGWQLRLDFQDEPDDPIQHVLAQGIGKTLARGNIIYSSLPRDGEIADRWGQ